eukprot:jgi/Bigna1/138137/aug1.43_g12845
MAAGWLRWAGLMALTVSILLSLSAFVKGRSETGLRRAMASARRGLPYASIAPKYGKGASRERNHRHSSRGAQGLRPRSNLRKIIEYDKEDKEFPGYDERGFVFDTRYRPLEERQLEAALNLQQWKEFEDEMERDGKPIADDAWIKELEKATIEMEMPNQFGFTPRMCDWLVGALVNNMSLVTDYRNNGGLSQEQLDMERAEEMQEAAERFFWGFHPSEQSTARPFFSKKLTNAQEEALSSYIQSVSTSADAEKEEKILRFFDSNPPLQALTGDVR